MFEIVGNCFMSTIVSIRISKCCLFMWSPDFTTFTASSAETNVISLRIII